LRSPQKGEKGYITEEKIRHVRNQRPASSDLLKKYEYQYQQRLQRESVIAIFWMGQKWAKEQDGPRKRVWQDYRSDPVRVFEGSKAM
jgi:hypothetical protein